MTQMNGLYQGQLRSMSTHLASGNSLLTDAPTDNHGKGEAFSPTDLLCTALGSCMMTLMGIVATREGLALEGTRWDIIKIMADAPRRVAAVKIDFFFPEGLALSETQKQKLENAARNCPVALSLSGDLQQEVAFHFAV